MDKAQEKIAEILLDQGIKELFYAFAKNRGNLSYCIEEIRKDFAKAGYRKPPEGKPPEITKDKVRKIVNFVMDLDMLTGIEGDIREHIETAVIEGMKAQWDSDWEWFKGGGSVIW